MTKYKKVSKEEYNKWVAANPGKVGRIGGKEVQNPYPEAKDLGGIGNFLRAISRPVRTALAMPESIISDIKGGGKDFESIFLTPQEEIEWERDPVKMGVKGIAGLGSMLMPAGGVGGAGTLGRIGTAARRGAMSGAMGGFGLSEEEKELESTLKGGLTGGVLGGVLQGVGEGAQALARKKAGVSLIGEWGVDDIAALPRKTQKGLVKQAKAAGFWDDTLAQSKNIQNYLKNRGISGNTPAETLEKMTQEYDKALKLKGKGLKEMGGLSRGYTEIVKDNLDEAIKYGGVHLDSDATKVYNDIIKTLREGPQDAKSLDKIVQKWYKAGLTAKGAQKMTTAGLYADAAKSLRDVLRQVPGAGNYDKGLTILNQILGVEDVGMVAKTAKTAAGGGIDLPLFSGAGFRGADIKTPAISDTISKMRAALGRAQETGGGVRLGQRGADIIEQLAGLGQRAIPVAGGMAGITQPRERVEEIGGTSDEVFGPPQYLSVQQNVASNQMQRFQLFNQLTQQGMKFTDAQRYVDMAIPERKLKPLSEEQQNYSLASVALRDAYDILNSEGGAGKIATFTGKISDFFGNPTVNSKYRNALNTAMTYVKAAMIGKAQTEIELKNLDLPKATDEPRIAIQKIERLIPLLEKRATPQIQGGTDIESLFNTLGYSNY